MKLALNEAGFYLNDLYPYLGPGVLCQHRDGWKQWLGLPFLNRPGYLSFTGTYQMHWLNGKPSISLKEFGRVRECQYCRGNPQQATNGRLARGFILREDSITLEQLVEHRYLHAHHLRPAGISRILAETFHELQFSRLTTEPVLDRVAW